MFDTSEIAISKNYIEKVSIIDSEAVHCELGAHLSFSPS